jgi:hypothetical protein
MRPLLNEDVFRYFCDGLERALREELLERFCSLGEGGELISIVKGSLACFMRKTNTVLKYIWDPRVGIPNPDFRRLAD